MEIIHASFLGFCMGVKKAMEKAEQALDTYSNRQVYSLGPLIHNSVAMKSLEEKGLKVLPSENPETLDSFDGKNSVVIIRAHGVSPIVKEKLNKSGAIVIDATCPKVLFNQKKAADFAGKGFDIIIAGDKKHGEVAGIQGVAESEKDSRLVEIVENPLQAESLCLENENCVILSQTTFSPLEYEKIVETVREKKPGVLVLNTICSATEERQNALHELCKKCDVVLVIGGKNSANTKRLYHLANSHCFQDGFRVKKVFHFEGELKDKDEFCEVKQAIAEIGVDCVVGITAGASTPQSSISFFDEILNELS